LKALALRYNNRNHDLFDLNANFMGNLVPKRG